MPAAYSELTKHSVVPESLRIHVSEPPDKFIEAIKENGCVIIKNFATLDQIRSANDETREWLDNDKPWKGALFPPETRRCTRLVQRSPTVRNHFLIHPLVKQLTAAFVDKTTKNWYGEKLHVHTSKAQLDQALSMEIGPGAAAQRLHRDDKNFHGEHTDRTQTGYRTGDDTAIGFLIAGVDVTADNGATMVIPGSHLWGDDRAPKDHEAILATMNRGDAVAFLGSLYHAGGANTTTDDRRTIHSLFFNRGYYKPQENTYLSTTVEEVLSWPEEIQDVMGYNISSPTVGHVDFMPPVLYFKGLGDLDHIPDLDPSEAAMKRAETVVAVA
ncbi:Phytanoyl- dioxygenase [Fusarium albosuccineum]|uniref:Phytanoyl- dioxygenase n=1 Tax=Fusarium albosuccineum TaxID=1237068 RepID=A0A8H4L936_9HYPO|nr:Phytanoyl- dioxygenase [Fusarium albosuccineum]